uniref:FERM and PDZ domain containing 2 n=1 Tax=Mus musculus TaxID=10090 RepID=A0A140LHS0_MOUSE
MRPLAKDTGLVWFKAFSWELQRFKKTLNEVKHCISFNSSP